MNLSRVFCIRGNAILFSLIAGGVPIGCGNAGAARSALIGSVTLDGEPVTEGSIRFTPTAGTKGPLTGGNIRDGQYEIPQGEGPFPGNYRVEITALRKTGNKVPNLAGELVEDEKISVLPQGKYDGPSSSLEVEIETGQNVHDFELTSE